MEWPPQRDACRRIHLAGWLGSCCLGSCCVGCLRVGARRLERRALAAAAAPQHHPWRPLHSGSRWSPVRCCRRRHARSCCSCCACCGCRPATAAVAAAGDLAGGARLIHTHHDALPKRARDLLPFSQLLPLLRVWKQRPAVGEAVRKWEQDLTGSGRGCVTRKDRQGRAVCGCSRGRQHAPQQGAHLQAAQRHHGAAFIVQLGIPPALRDKAVQPARGRWAMRSRAARRGGSGGAPGRRCWVLAAGDTPRSTPACFLTISSSCEASYGRRLCKLPARGVRVHWAPLAEVTGSSGGSGSGGSSGGAARLKHKNVMHQLAQHPSDCQ